MQIYNTLNYIQKIINFHSKIGIKNDIYASFIINNNN